MSCYKEDLRMSQRMLEIAIEDRVPQSVVEEILQHQRWLQEKIDESRLAIAN